MGLPIIKLMSICSPIPATMLTGTGGSGSRASNLVTQGIVFDGNRANNINHGTPDGSGNQTPGWEGLPLAAISIAFTDGVKVRDCHVKNMWASGIWLVDCTDEEVSSCRVTTFRKTGIAIRRYAPTGSPGSTTFRVNNNYVNGGGVGIHSIFGAARGVISGNNCENNRDCNEVPSFAWDGAFPNVWPKGDGQDWTQYGEGGYVAPSLPGDGAGIELSGYHTAPGAIRERYLTISANVTYDNIIGIRLEQECRNVTVTDNICAANTKYGIFAFSATDAIIEGNQCDANGEHGISVAKADGQAPCANLQILDNQCSGNQLFGIAIERGLAILIADNLLAANWAAGSGTGGAIGLFRDGTDACAFLEMRDNFISQTGGYWLYYDNTGHSASFIDNQCYGTPTNKMNNVNRTNTLIRGNIGLVTRNKGSGTVAQDSFVPITHGLDFIPYVADIRVVPVEDLLTSGRIYLSPAPGATTFDVIMGGGPATLNFAWSVDDH